MPQINKRGEFVSGWFVILPRRANFTSEINFCLSRSSNIAFTMSVKGSLIQSAVVYNGRIEMY